MTETVKLEGARIAEQLARAYEGGAWHGPALREVLADVTAESAAARPIPGAHSIWEIVLHIAVWEDVVRRRLEDQTVQPTDAEDWPRVTDTSDAAWSATLARLERGNRALRETMARLDERALDQAPAGSKNLRYVLAHGVVQHDLYHAGQIALLRKGMRR
jgi:uncharacterized damage-inducible protein DinB